MKASSSHASPPPNPAESTVPRHVAVIMDGNGRWAKAHGLPRTAGHKQGAEALRTTLNACRDMGIQYLTIYAFSSENWKRPAAEVQELMLLLRHYLKREINTMHENGVRMHFIGDRELLAPDIRALIADSERLTVGNTAFHLTIALSYGARAELVRAMRGLAQDIAAGKLQPEGITEETIASRLDTHQLPDPDLLIRTGGEQRLSNFLLWQAAYTELYFTPVLWPDFSVMHLQEACHDFARRERRFGYAT